MNGDALASPHVGQLATIHEFVSFVSRQRLAASYSRPLVMNAGVEAYFDCMCHNPSSSNMF